jgi:hypothetical protein
MTESQKWYAATKAVIVYMVAAVALAGTWRTPGALAAWMAVGCGAFNLSSLARESVEDAAGLVPAFVVVCLGRAALLAAPWLPLAKGLG